MAKVAVDCDTVPAEEAQRRLRAWLEAVEVGELDGNEMLFELVTIEEMVEEQRRLVIRALGN